MNRIESFKSIQNDGLELFTKKNKDYGDAFSTYGTVGVIMRMEDKMRRYLSITKSGVNLVNDESLKDTLIDLMNYSTMALMLLNE